TQNRNRTINPLLALVRVQRLTPSCQLWLGRHAPANPGLTPDESVAPLDGDHEFRGGHGSGALDLRCAGWHFDLGPARPGFARWHGSQAGLPAARRARASLRGMGTRTSEVRQGGPIEYARGRRDGMADVWLSLLPLGYRGPPGCVDHRPRARERRAEKA